MNPVVFPEIIQHSELGSILPLWSIIPFVGILFSIAFLPLLAPRFWHHHFGKIALFWALLLAVPYVGAYGDQGLHALLHILLVDYLPFVILLWGLYTTAGGILIKGNLPGTPMGNTLILLAGTLIASWIGTTGAAMLLIRPLLHANAHRRDATHTVVFFIFLVANIGGCLTPLGDPPLFLGFLHGVSFFWTTVNLLPEMLLVSVMALMIYYLLDSHKFHQEPIRLRRAMLRQKPFKFGVGGSVNVLFLLGIIGAVLFSGTCHLPAVNIFSVSIELQNLIRDISILLIGFMSLTYTPEKVRVANHFSWFPITEVAKLFVGIFITIVPVLAILKAGEDGALAPLINMVNSPWHFFWVTGLLSSFLDNAPTYLTFFNTALGKQGCVDCEVALLLGNMSHSVGNQQFIQLLKAISCGAVFMGANTYIGNAPNFMVKSIAEENRVKMPGFFGYMAWSLIILLPLFIIVSLEFFGG